MNLISRNDGVLKVTPLNRSSNIEAASIRGVQIGTKFIHVSSALIEALEEPKDGDRINTNAKASVGEPTRDVEPAKPVGDDTNVPAADLEGDLSNTEVVNQNFRLKLGFVESAEAKNLVAYKEITILNWEEIPGIINRLKEAAKEQFSIQTVDIVVLEAHLPTISATSTSDDKIVDFLTSMLNFLIKVPEEETTDDTLMAPPDPVDASISEELELPRDFYSLAIEFGFTPVISERDDATKMQRDNLFLYLIYSDPFDIIYKSYEIRENGMGIHSGNSYAELEQYLTKYNDTTNLV